MSIVSSSAFTFPSDIALSSAHTDDVCEGYSTTIVKKDVQFDDKQYFIYNNNPTAVNIDSVPDRMFRSVVTDLELSDANAVVLSVAPPNSISPEEFEKRYTLEKNTMQNVYANEIIEGTMVNLFYDSRYNQWDISTRSSVGAKYWYFRTQYDHIKSCSIHKSQALTFREMFIESVLRCKVKTPVELNDLELIQKLDKSYCYHFVFQHPDNHFVFANMRQVYLVGVHQLSKKSMRYIPASEYEQWPMFQNTTVMFPVKVQPQFNEASGHLELEKSTLPYTVGTMYTHLLTGDRMFYTRTDYEEWRLIRGNNPNLQYHFYQLLTNKYLYPNNYLGTARCFLELFPMYNELFMHFNMQYMQFIHRIYTTYVEYYIEKKGAIFPKEDFRHASDIHHKIYIDAKSKGQKVKITKEVIMEYFENMTPSQIMYFVNHCSPEKTDEIDVLHA